jgi:uncharacterized protein YaaQ
MKLLIIIVAKEDAQIVTSNLIKAQYFVTKLATTGGFLMSGNTTLLVGTEDEKVDQVIEIVGQFSKTRKKLVPNPIPNVGIQTANPIEVQVGGATIFVLDMEKYIKL